MSKKEINNVSPFFSIIIPSFNREATIGNAIASVINQQFTNFELLVIDDGSKDSTSRIIKKVKDKRIRYFYKKNEERSIARNYGIEKAEGKYICFLDSDDIFFPNHLQVFYGKIQALQCPQGLFHTTILKKKGHNSYIMDWFLNKSAIDVVRGIIAGKVLYMNGICVSREILDNLKFPESYNYWEDQHLWIRILINNSFYAINENTSQWNVAIDRDNSNIFDDRSGKQLDLYLGCIDNLQHDPLIKGCSWVENKWFIKLKLKKTKDFLSTHNHFNLLSVKQYCICLKYLNILDVTRLYFNVYLK